MTSLLQRQPIRRLAQTLIDLDIFRERLEDALRAELIVKALDSAEPGPWLREAPLVERELPLASTSGYSVRLDSSG